ncbi:BnaA10g28440D [Brassica napus]|uniref:BnaA10g28440D protein n=1 Tax=Brassica napus TaxID=3708 RepID=A0A078ITR9_BRANA|nr:BnaA10g28440D [Brassica napus]
MKIHIYILIYAYLITCNCHPEGSTSQTIPHLILSLINIYRKFLKLFYSFLQPWPLRKLCCN